MKLGFFASYDKFLIFVRKTIGVTEKMVATEKIEQLWKDITAGMQKLRKVDKPMTDSEAFDVVDYMVSHPYSEKSVVDILEEIKQGKVLDPDTKFFRNVDDKPVNIKAGTKDVKIKEPESYWTETMKQEAAKRQVMREDAKDLLEKYGQDNAQYQAKMQEIRKSSENLGEQAAEQFVQQTFSKGRKKIKQQIFPPSTAGPDYNAGKGAFDKIYELEDGTYIFIEAKGGKSPRGAKDIKQTEGYIGQRVEQGTKPYLLETALEMEQSGLVEKEFLKKVQKALEDDKLKYYEVRQGFDNAGNLLPPEIKQYQL